MDLLGAMLDHMPKLKAMLDGVEADEFDRLAVRFPDFGYYAAMLTGVAQAIVDGDIRMPPADDDDEPERSFPWIAEMKFAPHYAGLIKFILQSDWEEAFEDVLEEHFGTAMDEFDFDDAGITDAIGEGWTASVWMSALEHLTTRVFDLGPDGAVEPVNVVEDFVASRKVPGPARLYLRALQSSVMSLYEVSDIGPGVSLRARDLIRGGEPLLVHERSGTASLKQWDRIGARIITVAGKQVLAAGVLKYNYDAAQALLDGFRQVEGKTGSAAPLSISDDGLRELAHLFSTAWLYDVIPSVTGMLPKPVYNSDGEELVFHRIRFPLTRGVAQSDIAAKLATLPELVRDSERLWVWQGASNGAAPARPMKGRSGSLLAALADGMPVLGQVELSETALTVSVTSAERAELATVLFTDLLGEGVGVPLTVIETLDQARDALGRNDSIEPSPVPDEVTAPLVHNMLDRHYRATLDHPVPMLGNVTPRDAARTPAGRIKVADWLKYLETITNNALRQDTAVTVYDFGWVWRELKIEELRR